MSSKLASQINAENQALPELNTATARAVRRQYSLKLKQPDPAFILKLASDLIERYDQRWLAYELIRNHKPAF